MNHYVLAFLALDIAQQRTREAEQRWLMGDFTGTGPTIGFRLRRVSAVALASVSRGTAWVVRRLDRRVADDLGRTLAPAE